MKSLMKVGVLSLVLLFGAFVMVATGDLDPATKDRLEKRALFEFKFFDVNTISCTINSAGPYADYLRTTQSGLEWPKGSGKTAVFTAGVWIIGKHAPTGILRTAVQDYQTEYKPGPILGVFNTTTNDPSVVGDPNDQRYRIYKINKSDSVGGVNPDYDEWPADLGAPVDSRGKPKFVGDQQLWVVYNDADPAPHGNTGVTAPMGIEIQTLYFGFNQPGAIGNTMFMKWLIINKSDADYEDAYISMWSDTDLGDANDDLVGVDTTLSLGYVYNVDNFDGTGTGYGDKPPADGFDFFQGPIVAGAPTDTARFLGRRLPGFKNLQANSHAFYINGDARFNDPPLGGVRFSEAAYAYQRGINGTTLEPYIDPTTGRTSTFVFSGDPVAGTGWLPALSNVGGADVRSMLSAGPFTLAKGDTQEIVGGFVIAQGSDRLNSVSLLKKFDLVAQDAFNANFILPSPPPAPVVKVAELPNEIILSWYDGRDASEPYTFTGSAKDYKFEGYNVYQGKSVNGPWKRLATYDIVNGVKTVFDFVLDPETGLTLDLPVVFGEDSGVKRHIRITKDAINNTPLVNGKEYYFSLTSYAYNHDASAKVSGVPLVLENARDAITSVPHGTAIGSTVPVRYSEVLPTSRQADDAVVAEVIDPLRVTGDTYRVTFNTDALLAVTSWNLLNVSTGDTLVSRSTDFSGGVTSPIVNGLLWRVQNPVAGLRRDTQDPAGWAYEPSRATWFEAPTEDGKPMQALTNEEGFGAFTAAMVGFYENQASTVAPENLQRVEIRFTNNPSKMQKAYRYLRNARSLAAIVDSSFLPYVNLASGGFPYQGDYGQVTVPFTVWEVDPLDGDPTPRQLNVGFLENNDSLYSATGEFRGRGKIDGKWEPTYGVNGGREVVYIFASDYSATEDTTYTISPLGTGRPLNMLAEQKYLDVLYIMWLKKIDSTSTWSEGDVLTLSSNYLLTPDRAFEVNTAPYKTQKGDVALMKDQMAKINVFPNPYFAHNTAEFNQFVRFVTITNLPEKATIRVFSLTGELLRTIHKDDNSTSVRWDLRNESVLPVASGIYIIHIEVPDVGDRILKLAVIQPEERPAKI